MLAILLYTNSLLFHVFLAILAPSICDIVCCCHFKIARYELSFYVSVANVVEKKIYKNLLCMISELIEYLCINIRPEYSVADTTIF